MNLWDLASGCAKCRSCEGAAYQTPPLLFAGNPSAPILAIGQNPGEIKASDTARQEWIEIFEHLHVDDVDVVAKILPVWYAWDFYGSPGNGRLGEVFGDRWLLNGRIMWTNAVRCRTPDNEKPDESMVFTCRAWTRQLLEGRKAVIMVGVTARQQILGDKAVKLEWGAPKKHPELGYILAIKHYGAWRGKEEVEGYKKAVDRIKELVL